MKFDFSKLVSRENTSSVKLDMCKTLFGSNDLLPMWVADMDIPTPQFIIDRLKKRLEHPILGYTIRDNEYNDSIVWWLKKRFGWEIKSEWLSYSPGIVAGLNHAVQAFTKPRDKVMIQTPVYHPFFYAIKLNGRSLVENPLVFSEGKYSIDFSDFEEKIKNGVKLFILCSPHNPVGRVWTKNELLRMTEICIRHNVKIVSDEIHADLVFKPNSHIPLASLTPDISKSTITFGSASKTFNIAGLATAYAVIEDQQMLKRYNLQIEMNGTGHGNLMGYEAVKAAYSSLGEAWLEQLLEYLVQNVNLVREFLASKLPNIHLVNPEGTYLLWLDFRKLKLSNEELKRMLVYEAKLGFNSGEIFGDQGEGFQRMNIACSTDIVLEALNRLEKAFK